MKKLLLILLGLTVAGICGCGLFGGTKPEELIVHTPEFSKEVPKPARREPGSLWAEDSRWNEIYTFIPSRKVGDTIMIKVADTLKFRIDQSLKARNPAGMKNQQIEKVAQGPTRPSDPESSEAKPEFNDGQVKAPTPSGPAKKNDTTEIEGTILEIPTRGVYRVYANKAMSLGSDNPYVIVDGHIRERDIAIDDSISSEAIFNLKVDAANLKPGTTVIKEKKG